MVQEEGEERVMDQMMNTVERYVHCAFFCLFLLFLLFFFFCFFFFLPKIVFFHSTHLINSDFLQDF